MWRSGATCFFVLGDSRWDYSRRQHACNASIPKSGILTGGLWYVELNVQECKEISHPEEILLL